MFRYERVNSIRKFTIVAEIVSLLKKIYNKDAPLRAAFKVKTLAVLFPFYPREMKTNTAKFKSAAILSLTFFYGKGASHSHARSIARAWHKHAHSFDRCEHGGYFVEQTVSKVLRMPGNLGCELDTINAISAADIAFIMSSSTSAWLLSPLECSPQKQNG